MPPATASAQVTNTSPPNPAKTWNVDISGQAGVSPGIGATTTGLDVAGAVALVRSNQPEAFSHRCLGITTIVTSVWAGSAPNMGNPREMGVFVGPRLDSGDVHGTGFVRAFAGARHLSAEPTAPGTAAFSRTTVGAGAGVGLEVIGILFDINWVMSPWEPQSSSRLTVSLGYIHSFRLSRGS